MKSVQIWSFFLPVFSCIRTNCEDIRTKKTPYLDTFHALFLCGTLFFVIYKKIYINVCKHSFGVSRPYSQSKINIRGTLNIVFPNEINHFGNQFGQRSMSDYIGVPEENTCVCNGYMQNWVVNVVSDGYFSLTLKKYIINSSFP